ncbi:hypothetical protein chiPu_0031552, partial [Chiloscyllium punctatum]|nr:hypothetical protein [Chiloscyllium punctatum]
SPFRPARRGAARRRALPRCRRDLAGAGRGRLVANLSLARRDVLRHRRRGDEPQRPAHLSANRGDQLARGPPATGSRHHARACARPDACRDRGARWLGHSGFGRRAARISAGPSRALKNAAPIAFDSLLSPLSSLCHELCRQVQRYSSGTRMDYFKRFNFLFAAPVFESDDLEGIRFNQIVTEIERSGFEVVRARKLEDAEIAVQTDAAIGCMVV